VSPVFIETVTVDTSDVRGATRSARVCVHGGLVARRAMLPSVEQDHDTAKPTARL
jgi:hypothetical protein